VRSDAGTAERQVFTNTVKGIGQLSIRLRDADVLVLIASAQFRASCRKTAQAEADLADDRVGKRIGRTPARVGIAVASTGSPVAPADDGR
jgi:D-3-phosphoglycerate dehydrogenase